MSETTALALRDTVISSFDDVAKVATAMTKSGFFADSKEQAQAITKILAGREMGFGPFASMTGIHIIQGRPAIGANLIAAAVKGSGRYNYRVVEMTEKTCSIDFYEGKEKIGNSTFTAEDARKAQTKNMDKYPRNMLFARAMSNGQKWFCPDAFNGATVYTPEELGAETDQDGNIITATFSEQPPTDKPTFTFSLADHMGEIVLPDSVPPLMWETAKDAKSSKGDPYLEMTDEDIYVRFNSLMKALPSYAGTKLENGQLKLAELHAHLMHRLGA